ncbi:MAG: hypothetical protein IPO18_08625 [bacterium]|nr:hypothetical protein [bacterium]
MAGDIDNTGDDTDTGEDMQAVLRGFVESALPFARDTTLPPGLLEQYTVGRLLREPTFCDTSYHVAGLVAPHRYLVISAMAVPLDDEDNPDRGLCVLQNDALLKVIDRVEAGDRAQVTLLHVPEPLLPWFRDTTLNPIEQQFVELARVCFAECLDQPPVPALDTDDWRDRLVYPIGFDDDGKPFDLPAGAEPEACPFAAGDTVTAESGVRAGDIVWFERTASDQMVIHVYEPDDVRADGSPRFRVVAGQKPNSVEFVPVD